MLATAPPPSDDDVERIYRIPWHVLPDLDLTDKFRLPGRQEYRLWPVQSKALYAAYCARGLFGAIGVGAGKTLICRLLPVVLAAKRPLLLLPPFMVEQWHEMQQVYDEHFVKHPNMELLTYSRLSVASGRNALWDMQPDVIICDEAHNLRNKKSARTRRFLEYFKDNPQTVACFLSGTMTTRRVQDYEHLLRMSLKQGTPLPLKWPELAAWGEVLNADGRPTKHEYRVVGRYWRRVVKQDKGVKFGRANFRRLYQRRLLLTPGVVATKDADVKASLLLVKRAIEVPESVEQAIRKLDQEWSTPDGEEEFEDALAYARVARQLSQGFFYRWRWDGPVNHAWLEARRQWHRQVRAQIERGQRGFDSPLLVYNGVQRGDLTNPALIDAFAEWQKHKDFPVPPTEPVWISDYLVKDAIEWASRQKAPCVLWVDTKAMEEQFGAHGIPVYGRGTELPKEPPPVICASIRVHGEGKNMQAWHKALVVSPPSNGKAWEQLLGRMHRSGQEADEVEYHYYAHTLAFQDAVSQARSDAKYTQETTGNRQRLCYASFLTGNRTG